MRALRTIPTSLLVVALASAPVAPLSAQFAEPCELGCIAVLGATSFITATGVSVAAGRVTGGLTSIHDGLLVWGASFAATAGAAVALSGNGERQERAVYAAGLGTLGGALAGAAVAAALGADESRLFSGVLIGAAAGALVGGSLGALTDADDGSAGAVPVLSLRLAL